MGDAGASPHHAWDSFMVSRVRCSISGMRIVMPLHSIHTPQLSSMSDPLDKCSVIRAQSMRMGECR